MENWEKVMAESGVKAVFIKLNTEPIFVKIIEFLNKYYVCVTKEEYIEYYLDRMKPLKE